MSNKFKNDMENNINKLEKSNDYLDKYDNKINTLNDKISKMKYAIKNNKALTDAEQNELQKKIKDITTQRDSINNEHHHAVEIIKKREKKVFKELEEKMKYDKGNGFDKDGVHKDTGTKYDPNGFDSYGIHINTNDKYNPRGFDIKGIYKNTKYIYDPNGFNRDGNHQYTKINMILTVLIEMVFTKILV